MIRWGREFDGGATGTPDSSEQVLTLTTAVLTLSITFTDKIVGVESAALVRVVDVARRCCLAERVVT